MTALTAATLDPTTAQRDSEPAPAATAREVNSWTLVPAEELPDCLLACNLYDAVGALGLRQLEELNDFLPAWRKPATKEDFIYAIQSDKVIFQEVVEAVWEYHH